MRRPARLLALLAATALLVPPASAQNPQPPHSWLFGAWIGGLYPAPSIVSAQECLAQPVVIFTRDIVMRLTITDQLFTQRLVETARTTAAGVEFHFAPSLQANQSSPFGMSQGGSGDAGFGCDDPDVLHVQRRGENEISFPGCPEFPYPLVRCPAR
ncbi:MAG TPA: hypothetical protein VHT74_25360 [Acetobacteraceae bacterium]|jgi:hypothetical protein|nr:hypothetical protein [Acetobacteraceae bacterium]